MSTFYGFKVCRVCLTPSTRVDVKTYFGDNAWILQKVSGVDILQDENKYDALVCDACWETMIEIVNFLENIKNWIIGDDCSPEKSDCCDNFNSLICLCCSSSLNIAFLKKMSEPTVKKLKEISGVDVTAGGLHSHLICLVCYELIEKSIETREQIEDAELFYFKKRRKDAEAGETLVVSENAKPSSKAKQAKIEENVVIKLELMPMEDRLTSGRFQCNLCDKSYASKQGLSSHINAIHFRNNEFSCDLCDYRTYLKPSIISHISRNHGTFLFKCTFTGCEKSFKTKNDRKLHQAVHTDARPFVCECGKTYKSYQAHYMHRRIKHVNQ